MRAAAERIDAGDQLGKCKRLDEIVVTPGIEAVHAITDAAECRQEQNGRFDLGATQRFDDVQPIHARHHAVDDHEIPLLALDAEEPIAPICEGAQNMAFFREPLGDVIRSFYVVFNEKNLHLALPGTVSPVKHEI